MIERYLQKKKEESKTDTGTFYCGTETAVYLYIHTLAKPNEVLWTCPTYYGEIWERVVVIFDRTEGSVENKVSK